MTVILYLLTIILTLKLGQGTSSDGVVLTYMK